ncbi:LexA/Signal peptidase [Testicularia cyperi]|uniref:LexA/Signal peptidase n=1 Tax=Testicularia cyperi TaxID=1882483 RepID=A0A317XYK0_9BASI|nr:LexA/Signal peptidase [Testicularia cyperi]
MLGGRAAAGGTRSSSRVRQAGGWRPYMSGRLLPKITFSTTLAVQIFCLAHLINEHVLEIRNTTGASMLPTLALDGDHVLHLRLPFLNFLHRMRSILDPTACGEGSTSNKYPYKNIGQGSFSKSDPAQGTGLKLGDLVVAISPFDPSRTVCKRVIGLPGDTVCLDPRMRPLPLSSWRGRKSPAKKTTRNSSAQANSSESAASIPGAKLRTFEDLLSELGATSAPRNNESPAEDGGVDLLKSMDTDALSQSASVSSRSTSEASPTPDTEAHNAATSANLVSSYVRSKGDVQYITIPRGHVWLAGDNMANSTDSRHYGPVPLGLIRGKAVARIWPNPAWLGNNVEFVD